MMKQMYFYTVPIGTIGMAEENGHITDLVFGEEMLVGASLQETPLLAKAALQLREYFAGQRMEFDLPISFEDNGTEFMRKVWHGLLAIPYAETRSYQDIAIAAGSPKACRAVGQANHRNPISIIVPCHRVIGASGKLVGYGGGLPIKEYLLDLEKRNRKKA